jgi:ubiquinone/menaquinone biosynthesis C-methylase UbiE
MSVEWWQTFFSGIVLDMWQQAIPEAHTRAEAEFISSLLRLPPGAHILDAPCGEGRIARELAAKGYQLTGVDMAQDFLEMARTKAKQRDLTIAFEQGDIRSLRFVDDFDGAVCWGNSFGYFDDAGNAAMLKSLARALRPGGRLVLDASSNAESRLPNFQGHEWAKIGDILFLEENEFDHVQGRMITHYTFVRDGKVEMRTGSHRIYTYRQICLLLGDAGFAQVKSYASLDKDPFKLGANELLMEAIKAS